MRVIFNGTVKPSATETVLITYAQKPDGNSVNRNAIPDAQTGNYTYEEVLPTGDYMAVARRGQFILNNKTVLSCQTGQVDFIVPDDSVPVTSTITLIVDVV